jgi:hypothetical protein
LKTYDQTSAPGSKTFSPEQSLKIGDLVNYTTRNDKIICGIVTRGGQNSVQVLLAGHCESMWLSVEYLELVNASR